MSKNVTIIKESKNVKVIFSNINCGDYFLFKDELYFRVNPCVTHDENGENYTFTCVRVCDGHFKYINSLTQVTPVEVCIKYSEVK